MKNRSKRLSALPAGLFVLVAIVAWQAAIAEDVVHAVSGIVKSVDKGTKTMVVKTSDGTEHTIKWTDKTTMKGVDATGKAVAATSVDTYDGLKEGTKVTVKYTEKGGEKTAVAVKDASKATAKAVTQ
jgi:Cu/Ag efflux protein CusF